MFPASLETFPASRKLISILLCTTKQIIQIMATQKHRNLAVVVIILQKSGQLLKQS